MVAYKHFVDLSASANSEDRGMAAHIAAAAFVGHDGPADENAALYAALIGFLDDSSVKVRAALAYGLLHAETAPRPIMLALLSDAQVIARAVAQFSPVIIDADLLGIIADADLPMLRAIAARTKIGPRIIRALVTRRIDEITLLVLDRTDLTIEVLTLEEIAETEGKIAEMRGALFDRPDLPATLRLKLIGQVREVISTSDFVTRAIPEKRIERMLRDAFDRAACEMAEASDDGARTALARNMAAADQINARLLLHALVHGQSRFFAASIANLAEVPIAKALAIIEHGSRPALHALFARTGLAEGLRNLLARLVTLSRDSDLVDDLAARHFVVTSLLSEMVHENEGDVDDDLASAFTYLGAQNIKLARYAARGVLKTFAEEAGPARPVPIAASAPPLALPAA